MLVSLFFAFLHEYVCWVTFLFLFGQRGDHSPSLQSHRKLCLVHSISSYVGQAISPVATPSTHAITAPEHSCFPSHVGDGLLIHMPSGVLINLSSSRSTERPLGNLRSSSAL
jgi:hypothetical protein